MCFFGIFVYEMELCLGEIELILLVGENRIVGLKINVDKIKVLRCNFRFEDWID